MRGPVRMTTRCHGLAAKHQPRPGSRQSNEQEDLMPELVGDATMSALHYALNGLALRQRTIADNIANIETPGFLAGKVSFEDALRSSVADGTDPLRHRADDRPLARAHPDQRQQRQPRRGDGRRAPRPTSPTAWPCRP